MKIERGKLTMKIEKNLKTKIFVKCYYCSYKIKLCHKKCLCKKKFILTLLIFHEETNYLLHAKNQSRALHK